VEIWVGSYPIEPGQHIFVEVTVVHQDGTRQRDQILALWRYNDFALASSYWQAGLGPFTKGAQVEYIVHGKSGTASVPSLQFNFVVED
jgi:hypothetical protein